MTAISDINSIRLYGRIFLTMDIVAVTGLRIGGSPSALAIGSLDNPVIRDPLTQKPYIPGSSLRGKMRSQWEKYTNASQNENIQDIRIHTVENKTKATVEDHENDIVTRIFGVSSNYNAPTPTRLVIHDTFLSEGSSKELTEIARTDQPYTETKWEASIDRITSAAVPRQMERVPAGAKFSDARLVYSIFSTHTQGEFADIIWFSNVLTMLQLVEDDYLGGAGSRGSGQVQFTNIRLGVKPVHKLKDQSLTSYGPYVPYSTFNSVQDLTNHNDFATWVYNQIMGNPTTED